MNKTMTRMLLCSILLLCNFYLLAQQQGILLPIEKSQAPGYGTFICLNELGQAKVSINIPEGYELRGYYFQDNSGGWPCFFCSQPDSSITFQIPIDGKAFRVKAECWHDSDGDGVQEAVTLEWSFYSPLDPSLQASPFALSSCNAHDGRIELRDNSQNPSSMPREYILCNSQGVELNRRVVNNNVYTFSNLEPGTYVVKLSTGCAEVQQTVIVPGGGLDAKITGTNVVCLGTGTELTAIGGTSYLWDNGATSSSITALPNTVGTKVYKVQVTNGTCTKEASYTVTVKAAPTAQISGPSSVCYNGSITLTASGSGTYAWTTGATTSSISVSLLQSNQTYGLTVTDPSTQCSSVAEHVVTVPPRPTLNEAPNSICTGESVSLSVSGGSSYSWNVGGTTASIVHSPGSSTEYRVTVTGANGCSYVLSKNISVTSPPNITFGGGTSICAGQSLNITAFGGSSYSWNYNSANTATITVSPVVNTTYTVTATSSGCSSSAQRVIVVKPSPIGNIDAPSSICPGQSVTLIATGGGTYLWNVGNATTASITVNPTQNTNYTVNISNVEGCTVVKSHAIAVNISGSASNDGPLTCSKTSATLTGTSSAQGASYRWKNASGVTIANTANTPVTTAGVYTLEITAAGGCTYSTATEVLQNLQTPSVSASNSGAITCTQSSVNLLGTSSASPATYEWRNGGGTLIANTLNTSVTQAGTYTLKVTAANGCSGTASTTVTADVATPQASIQHDGPLTCTKTSVTLSASPNNPNLQYTWLNSGGTVIASNSSSVVVTATGTYQLEARGSNGCPSTVSASITQSGNFPNISVNNPGYISCTSSGATISGNSTTPGVTYGWYNPNGRLMSTQKSFVTNIAGTYTLKVTSTEGCVSSASTTLGEDVPNDQAITLNVGGYSTNGSFAQGELTCTQNSIRLSVSARYAGYDAAVYWRTDAHGVIGSGNFEDVDAPGYYYVYHQECPAVVKEIYIKENRPAPVVQITGEKLVCVGRNTTLTASGGNQYYWSTGATSNTITAYVAGPTTYTVTVSKGTYCSTEASVTVDNHPYPIFNISGPTSSCAGTFVTLTVSGGHTYRWSHNNATTASINVAPTVPTSYTVTVTSDKGCATNKRHTISTVNSQPNDFTLNGEPTTAFCGEAPVNISVVNPNSNYTWKWSTGETTSYLQKTITSSQTISVTATRNNGCTRTKTVPITVNTKPTGLIQGEEINCAGGSTVLTAPLGETYLWSTGATSSSISVQPESDQTYSVTVSNAGGSCSTVFSKTLSVSAPLSLSHDLEGEDDCIPNNVTVIPTVSGGTGSIELSLAEAGTDDFRPVLNGLRSGNFVLRAKDTRGCIDTTEVNISEPLALDISNSTMQAVLCYGSSTGSISVLPTGGVAPYTYLWSTGATHSSITNLAAGTFNVTVTDSRGCTQSQTVLVPGPTQNNLPQITFSGDTSICAGLGFSLSASGGNTYAWNTGASTSSISGAPASTTVYTVTVTDAQGCSSSASQRVQVNPLPIAQINGGAALSPICGSGVVWLTATGGHTYHWSTGETSASISQSLNASASFGVTVKSVEGCTASASASVVVIPRPYAQITGGDIACRGNSTTLTASGGSTYLWSNTATSSSISIHQPTQNQTYSVTVSNGPNCFDVASKTIVVPDSFKLGYTLVGEQDCILNNTEIIPVPQHAQGLVTYVLNVLNPFDFSTHLQGWSSGQYYLSGIDAKGCMAGTAVNIQEPDPLQVAAQISGDSSDCQIGNVQVQLSSTGARGAVSYHFDTPQSALLTPASFSSSTMQRWVYAVDTVGCVDSVEVVVREHIPTKIIATKLLLQEDCIPGNTGLQISSSAASSPLQYRIQGREYQTNSVFNSVPFGVQRVYLQDSIGCVDSSSVFVEDERFPTIDTVDVGSCDSTNGVIRLLHSRPSSAWEYSIDDGQNWQTSNTFTGLMAGVYHPVVRKPSTGCILKGDSIRLGDTCSILPIAGFQDTVIYLTSPSQILNVKWKIAGKPIFNQGVDLLVRMEGNGLPHFGERYLTHQKPELRADNDRRYPYQYPNGHSRADSLPLPMGDSAQYYTYPHVYFFHLEKPRGAAVQIDPAWAKLRVVVTLNTPPVETYKTLYLCPDDECITIGEGNPINCITWQDEPSNSGSRQLCRPIDPRRDYVQYRLNEQLEIVEIIHYKIIELNFTVSIKPDAKQPQGCKGMPLKLIAELTGLDAARAKYLWSNGETTASITLPSPTPGLTIGVTVTDRESDCEATATYDIPNAEDNACKLYDYFTGKGFYAIKITVHPRPQANRPELRDNTCANNECVGASGICISDRSNGLTFDLRGGAVMAIASHVQKALTAFKAFDYNNGKGLITENEGMCACEGNENLLSSTEQRFEESELGYWLHIWEKGDSDCSDSDILFIKAKLPDAGQYSPGAETSTAFLDAALDHLHNDLNVNNGKMVENTMNLMLPNYAVPKDNTLFENNPRRPLLEDVEIITPCNVGFDATSEGAITLTGHVVQMPAEIITRYDLNPKLSTPTPGVAQGVLTGFTTFSQGKISGIFAGRFKKNSRNHVGYFSLDARDFDLTTSYPFKAPTSTQVRIHAGKEYNSIKEIDNCNNLIDVFEVVVTPKKTFVSQPQGEMITNILDAVDKDPLQGDPIKVYPICGHQLKSVLPAFTSLDQVTAYMVYNHAALGTGVMYQLNNPNRDWIFAQKDGEQTYYFFWNCYLGSWMQLPANSVTADDAEKIAILHQELENASFREAIHAALAVTEIAVTFICPVVGVIIAGADIVLYALEGDLGSAAVGAVGLAIGFGPQIGKAIKVVNGILKMGDNAVGTFWKVKCIRFADFDAGPELRSAAEKECLERLIVKFSEELVTKLVTKLSSSTGDDLTEKFLELLDKLDLEEAKKLFQLIENSEANASHLATIWKEIQHIPALLTDETKILELLSDLAKNEELLKAMGENVGLVKAWTILGKDMLTRTDLSALNKVLQYLDNSQIDQNILKADFEAAEDIAQYLDELGASSSGVWALPPVGRGRDIEITLGGDRSWPPNFPVIDAYDSATGTVISIKSIDLNAQTYQNISKLESRINNYVSKLKDFNGVSWGGVTVGNPVSSPIISRELKIGIPPTPVLDQALVSRLTQDAAGLTPPVKLTFIIVP